MGGANNNLPGQENLEARLQRSALTVPPKIRKKLNKFEYEELVRTTIIAVVAALLGLLLIKMLERECWGKELGILCDEGVGSCDGEGSCVHDE